MQTPGKQMVEQRASFNEKLAGRGKNYKLRKNKTKARTNRIKRRELKTRTRTGTRRTNTDKLTAEREKNMSD